MARRRKHSIFHELFGNQTSTASNESPANSSRSSSSASTSRSLDDEASAEASPITPVSPTIISLDLEIPRLKQKDAGHKRNKSGDKSATAGTIKHIEDTTSCTVQRPETTISDTPPNPPPNLAGFQNLVPVLLPTPSQNTSPPPSYSISSSAFVPRIQIDALHEAFDSTPLDHTVIPANSMWRKFKFPQTSTPNIAPTVHLAPGELPICLPLHYTPSYSPSTPSFSPSPPGSRSSSASPPPPPVQLRGLTYPLNPTCHPGCLRDIHSLGHAVRFGFRMWAWKRWQCCICLCETHWESGVCSNLCCGGRRCQGCGLVAR